MAFAVVCKSCQARFLLNDDLLRRKVAGKVVTVRCRQCHATIEVDASDVDPKSLPANEAPAPPPPPAPVAPRTMTLKATPSPPRPTKSSTLMGIGTPARVPTGANELVALSPGLMNAAPALSPQGFPEPPPPPGAVVEELSMSDWDIDEAPQAPAKPKPVPAKTLPTAPARLVPAPESLDDFVEELPPSSRPVEEDVPSSTGTPSLKALAHHDDAVPKGRSDDFLANMSAAMNGGLTASSTNNAAPTIDVSTLASAPVEAESPPSIDLSDFDVPVTGSKTLPLFALADSETAEPAAPVAPAARARPAPARSKPLAAAEGSLSPAALDQPRDADAAAGVRERKNVVAPATKSVPPPAAQQRTSGLAAPVLLALAAAAGFLIWKRSAAMPGDMPVRAEEPAHVAEAPHVAPPTPPAAPEPTLAASAAAPAPTEADDVTFETTPVKTPSSGVATREHTGTTDAASAPATPAVTKPEPTEPIAKETPKEPEPKPTAPAGPTEPAGPFDRAAASAALTAGAAQASSCKKEGDPSGVASVTITFAPSGRVTSANISGPPFAGTATGGCIAAALRKAHIPPFEGDRVTVSKTIVIQ